MRKRTIVMALATMLAVASLTASAVASSEHQTVGVNWHGQQAAVGNSGAVDGASATLIRRDAGVSYRVNTGSLTPGNAYSLWIVVVNNPGACDPKPCTGGDIITDPTTDSQVLYGTGTIVGGSGNATFAGSLAEGDLSGWLDDRSFDDAQTAEIHLVVNDHGPAIASLMPAMIKTYRAGCSADSPFPGIFPPSAINDGAPGPNICRLAQAAVFTAP